MDGAFDKLLPILREGVDVIKMVIFKHLKEHVRRSRPMMPPDEALRLTGAAVNELFGHMPAEEPHLSFALRHAERIQRLLREIPVNLAPLMAPITDALRMQCLCDRLEGKDSTNVLKQAQKLDILVLEREVPLPASFMSLVRSWGVASGILTASTPASTQNLQKS